MKKTVSVVIPNYNGITYNKACLAAMRRQTRPADRLIVVDNGSTDGSAEEIERLFPEAVLIRFPENTGFCGAVNAGIRASMDMDYVILLNNDTVAHPAFVEELLLAASGRRVFSAQAKMLQMQEPSKIDDAGDYYCAFGWAFAEGKGAPADTYRKSREIFACCAGAAIYSVPLLKEIGLFDENHFAYLEDIDIGWRARIRGYRNIYAPRARVLHAGSAASGSIYNLFKVRNTSRNSIYIVWKNMPWPQILLNLPLLLPGFFVKALFFALKGFGGEYIRGIARGFALCGKSREEGRKVPFRLRYLGNYLRIQGELWVNCLRRLGLLKSGSRS